MGMVHPLRSFKSFEIRLYFLAPGAIAIGGFTRHPLMSVVNTIVAHNIMRSVLAPRRTQPQPKR